MPAVMPELSAEDAARMDALGAEFEALLAKYDAQIMFQRIATLGQAGESVETHIIFRPNLKTAILTP